MPSMRPSPSLSRGLAEAGGASSLPPPRREPKIPPIGRFLRGSHLCGIGLCCIGVSGIGDAAHKAGSKDRQNLLDLVCAQTGLGGQILCDGILFPAENVMDDLGAVFFVSILELKVHAVIVFMLRECTEQRQSTVPGGSVLCHILDQDRKSKHDKLLDLLAGKTCFPGNRVDR